MSGRDALGGGDGLDFFDEGEVVLERFAGESWDLGAKVVGGEGGGGVDGADEEAFAERAERDEPDAEFCARGEDACSGRRHHRLYSLWMAVTGCTAWPRRSRSCGPKPAVTPTTRICKT